MSSEWPISTAVMPSCWASWVSSVNWLAVMPSGRNASSYTRVMMRLSWRMRVDMQAADVFSAISVMSAG